MSDTPPRPRGRERDAALIGLIVILILCLAAGLRFYNLGVQSLWADEGNSATMATRSLAEIAVHAANDIHPPLYYWLLRLWTQVAGTSEVGLRSFSAALGVLLVLLTIGIGMRLGGVSVGLVAGLLAAASPFQVYYSQEARMYILLAAEAAAAVYGFWWLISREDRQLPEQNDGGAHLRLWSGPMLFIALTWICGLYTHYAFPVMIAILSLAYLVWVFATRGRGSIGRRAARWALYLGIALVMYVPWLGVAFRQLTTWPTGGQPVDLWQALQTALTTLSLGPTGLLSSGQWWLWLLPALALLGCLPWPGMCRRPAGLSWALPVVWLVGPLGMMLVLGLFRDAYLKFLLIAGPAMVLLLARGSLGPGLALARLRQTSADTGGLLRTLRTGSALGALWGVAATVAIFGLSVMTLNRYFSDPKAARDDYRGITQFVEATSLPSDSILLVAPGQAEVFGYYYNGDLPVYALPKQRPLVRSAVVQDLAALLAYDKVYAIYWANQEADPEDIIESWMNHRGYKTLDQWRGSVRLVVYVMPERRPLDEQAEALNLALGPDILLKGYRGGNLTLTAGEVAQLQLIWQAVNKPAGRYKVFLQLLDAHDQVIAQRDSEPVGDSRPTDTWQAGEEILDNHGVLIPPGTPPGDYRRILGLYDQATGQRLRLPDGKDYVSLPPVRVTRASTPPPLAALNIMHDQQFDFGAITLLGYDQYKRDFGHAPETPIYPGDRLHLTLYWQANVRPRAVWWFDLTLVDASGRMVARLRWPLVGESYPTTMWAKGEVVRGEHDLQLPADLRPGDYRLSLTMLPDDETEAGSAYLGAVEVAKPAK